MSVLTHVGATKFTMPNDVDVVATREFDAPRQVIFDGKGHLNRR